MGRVLTMELEGMQGRDQQQGDIRVWLRRIKGDGVREENGKGKKTEDQSSPLAGKTAGIKIMFVCLFVVYYVVKDRHLCNCAEEKNGLYWREKGSSFGYSNKQVF